MFLAPQKMQTEFSQKPPDCMYPGPNRGRNFLSISKKVIMQDWTVVGVYGKWGANRAEFGREDLVNYCRNNMVIMNQESHRELWGFVLWPTGEPCLKPLLSSSWFLLVGLWAQCCQILQFSRKVANLDYLKSRHF